MRVPHGRQHDQVYLPTEGLFKAFGESKVGIKRIDHTGLEFVEEVHVTAALVESIGDSRTEHGHPTHAACSTDARDDVGTDSQGFGYMTSLGRPEVTLNSLAQFGYITRSRRARDFLGQQFRPEHANALGGERSTDKRPVCIDETQHPGDRRRFYKLAHEVNLMEDSFDQFRTVTPSHEQALGAGAKNSAIDAQLRPPAVTLGVNHPDPGSRHDDVVDVGPRARDSPIVQNYHLIAREPVEPGTQTLLPDGASFPRLCTLPLPRERHSHAAENSPFGA